MPIRNRELLLSRFSGRYRKVEPFGPECCGYCGDPANSVDHIPPLSALPAFELSGYFPECIAIPACIDCNVRLGSIPVYTLKKRRRVVLTKLQRKYRNILRKVVWDESELNELGNSLKSYIEAAENRRQWVLERLKTLRENS